MYRIYAEALEHGVWRCIDMYSKKEDGSFELEPVYWSGSRSYFGDAAQTLTEEGRRLKDPSALSPELMEYFDNEFKEDYTGCVWLTMLQDVRRIMPPTGDHQYHGVVHKDEIFSFEHEGAEYVEPISDEDYSALPEAMQKCYQYYEWDDPAGWVAGLREVLNNVDLLLASRPPWERDGGVIRLVMTMT